MQTIKLAPSRNLICFNKFSDIDIKIINSHLQNIISIFTEIESESENTSIASIDSITSSSNTTFEIRSNSINRSIKITITTKCALKTNESIIKYVLKAIQHVSLLTSLVCVYFQLNDTIIINNRYIDAFEISYSPVSFRQPDDAIRTTLISYFQNEIASITNSFACYLIGGECVLFGKIMNTPLCKHKFYYTDYQSIYNDILFNNADINTIASNDKAFLINYNIDDINFNLQNSEEKEEKEQEKEIIAIVNTGYQGCGEHLAKCLANSQCTSIVIISCNKKSFAKDFAILETNYKIAECDTQYNSKYNPILEISTNYSIWIYKLEKK